MNTHVHLSHLAHLSDAQIDDYLIGDLPNALRAHLAACDLCQARVAELEAPIASFKAVSLAWSERHSATLPLRPAGLANAAWGRRAAWAITAATALAFGIAAPLLHHDSAPVTPSAAQTHLPAPTASGNSISRDEQIAQDNRMLQTIDSELTAAPADTFGLEHVSHPGPGRHHNTQVRN